METSEVHFHTHMCTHTHTQPFACGRNSSYLPQNKKIIFVLIRHLKSQLASYNRTQSYTHSVWYFPEN